MALETKPQNKERFSRLNQQTKKNFKKKGNKDYGKEAQKISGNFCNAIYCC